MTLDQFVYWLQGYVELTQRQAPTPEQWNSICEHLDLVFAKVTPPVAPFDGQSAKSFEELLRQYRDTTLPPHWWQSHPYTVTC